MKIRTKISLIIFGFFLTLFIFTVVLSNSIILQNYEALDSSRVSENSLSNISSIESLLNSLSANNRDWSVWDASYQFIDDLNDGFIAENVNEAMFENLNLGFMLFLDPNGNLKYGQSFDPATSTQSSLDPELKTDLLSGLDLVSDPRGLFSFKNDTFLVVSNPILRSDGGGDVKGYLVWGKFFDINAFNEAAKQSGGAISLVNLPDEDLPGDFQQASAALNGGAIDQPAFVQVQDENTISAYAFLSDVKGKAAYIIRTDSSRDVFHRGQTTINWFLILFGGVGLVFSGGIYLFIGRSVVSPIVKLGNETKIAAGLSHEERAVSAKGTDEIALLGSEINQAFQEIKKYENSLCRSIEEWQTTFDSISDPVLILDPEFRIVRVNRAYLQALKTERTDILGMHCYELAHGSDKPHPKCPFRETLKTRRPATAELFDTGNDRYSEVSTYPIFDEQGNITTVIHIAKNITQRKRFEEQLKSISLHQEIVLSTVPDIIVEVDNSKKYTWANQAGIDFFGDDFIGREAADYFEGDNDTYDIVKPVFEGSEETLYVENWQRRKDGEKRLLGWWCRALKDVEGNVTGALSAANDITEREHAKIAQDELRKKAEVSSRLAAIGEMAAGIAHEINNPLTGVIGFAELLSQRTDLPEDVKQDIEIIHDGSERVKEIVRRMLTFARQSKPFRTSTDITELIDNTLALRSYVLKTANITVETHYEPDLPWLTVDPSQMQQVFLNLVVNAEYSMKKAHGQGLLSVHVGRVGEVVAISFTDDGLGIPQEYLPKLFEPFFSTKEVGEGTGLGLSVSHGIVTEHGGTIIVSSGPGKGATFTVNLPVDKPALEADPTVIEADPMNIQSEGKTRVLVLDDEPYVRSFVKAILDSANYEVEECDTPDKALKLLDLSSYDILLFDVRMPGMSGTELLDRIASSCPEIQKRVLFITGDTSDKTIRDGLHSRNLPYIAKPFSRSELETAIRRVMGQQKELDNQVPSGAQE